MFKIMVVVQGKLGKIYCPVAEQEKKVDADKDADAFKKMNEGYKFAVMDEVD